MLNFLTNVFNEKSNARSTCGSYDNPNNVVQECVGCDSECMFSCYTMCASECQEQSADNGGDGGGTCNTQCTGTCFSLASIFGLK